MLSLYKNRIMSVKRMEKRLNKVKELKAKQVALLQMPWGVIDRGTLCYGLLKKILEDEGILTKVYYLNLRFIKFIEQDIYELISSKMFYIGEWIFSQFLFRDLLHKQKNINFINLIEDLSKDKHYSYLVHKLISMRSKLEDIINISIPAYINECLDDIPWKDITIAGFTCKIGTQTSSLALAWKLKECFPHIKIIFGGPNVFDKMGEEIITSFDWIDYVIDGEAEKAFIELSRNIISKKYYDDVLGVLMRCENRIFINKPDDLLEDLDSLPIPDYSEYFEELKNSSLDDKIRKIVIPIESTRGCWWGEKDNCTFCAVNNGKPKYRSKSSNIVMNEILTQLSRYHVRNFYAADSIINMKFFNDLIPELADRKLDLDIYIDIKPCLNRKQIELLYKAGVKTVLAGIESLNNKLLNLMHKGITTIQNIQLLKICYETGIHVLWNLLYGIPGEDPACYSEIINIIPLISHLEPSGGIVRISLDRFSPYQYEPEKYGIQNIKPSILYRHIYPYDKINLDNIAYTFEYEYENSKKNIAQYEEELFNTVMRWNELFYKKRPKCEYIIDGDEVKITDTRPRTFKDMGEENIYTYKYKGLEKDIYIYCSEIRSFQEIQEYLDERTSFKYSENDLKKLLTGVLMEFINEKLMFEENSKYLSLAVANEKTN